LSESLEQFRVAVAATSDGKYTFQIFSVCGEPQTLQTDSRRYMTPADAAQAGYEAIAANSKVSPDTPIE
jgi:predicted ATPase